MKNFRAAKFHKRIRTKRLRRKVFSQMLVFYIFGKNKGLNDRFLPTKLKRTHIWHEMRWVKTLRRGNCLNISTPQQHDVER
jgi:hypothetical protein